jgi:hypothetical protein
MCLPTVAPETRRWESSQTISKSNPSSRGALRGKPTEYSANGSFTRPHCTQSFFFYPGALPRRPYPGASPGVLPEGPPPACIEKIYGQASRLISIGKLNASPRLHTRPITWSSSRSL